MVKLIVHEIDSKHVLIARRFTAIEAGFPNRLYDK